MNPIEGGWDIKGDKGINNSHKIWCKNCRPMA